jgi:2-polyprenyl-3-methyl-5-hydroxy-6-metoxy-1,4-benzoquinol methylase
MNFNCDSQNSTSWQMRADEAVTLLLESKICLNNQERKLQISDFGCGNRRLKNILNSRLGVCFEYYGYDLQPQSDETYQIDLESEIPSRHFDIVFCLGLLEYLKDVDVFFANISRISTLIIVSYVIKDSKLYSPADIQQKQWLHHYSCQELENKMSGFTIANFRLINQGKTGLWLLKSNVK